MRVSLVVVKPMYRSTDSYTGSPSFTLVTKRLDDGRYEASCQSLPNVKAEVAAEEVDAIRALQRKVEEYVIRGGR